ncbi:hypothetical protein DFH07DRAFT_844919, partial [Mycena maculata]
MLHRKHEARLNRSFARAWTHPLLLLTTTMQRHPHPVQQSHLPPLYAPNPNANRNPPTQRAHAKPLRPAIKYPVGWSTNSVWGGSTAPDRDADSDTDTVRGTIGTSASVASSQSRAPGNEPAQERRVVNWVHDTGHHAPHFKSPFTAHTGTSYSYTSTHHTHSSGRSKAPSSHHRHSEKRPLPPVWVPRPAAPPVMQRAVSQPALQYQQQPPQAPPMMWVTPAPARS